MDKIKCSTCHKELTELGGLLFSPPTQDMVRKWHLCRDCYEEICHLFEPDKPEWAGARHHPELDEPKPDESRLLTQREIIGLVKATPTDSELALALIARREQDAKTASILRVEFVNEKVEFGLSVNEAAYKQGRNESNAQKQNPPSPCYRH